MPRMTVYAPESLWAEAKTEAPELSPSQLVQSALRGVVQSHRPRPDYADLSDDLAAERDRVRADVRAQATAAYQAGYRLGLALADELHWVALAAFANCYWKFGPWSDDVKELDVLFADPEWNEEVDLDAALDQLVSELHLPTATVPPDGYVKEGLEDAVRDVWEGLGAPRAARDATAGEAAEADQPEGGADVLLAAGSSAGPVDVPGSDDDASAE